ncbi:DUF2637 domain-containing protein [Streptomyces sp. NBC_00344]|uniref:DUF2637 domain-containing protein n=1 Tax=Streptomyces sp. NBC_00344 TaxID=2975720 RepID=UPI002E1CFD60
MQLTRTHRILIAVVVAGAVIIAGIGFAGSYAAVRRLAEQKGFGTFSLVFPIGIDAGICVLLALDLLLTWIRIPFPLLRQTAWLLTAATIAFNGAAAWPDPLGTGMHAVIPILFVVCVEAARHAVGRIADITADKHMEGVRLTRWLLSPIPTFRLWRRMKLWELRSYDEVIKLEQDRLIYRARLQARFGRNWRRKAPIESLMPLRLAKYGVPLAETGPSGLAAAAFAAKAGQQAGGELPSAGNRPAALPAGRMPTEADLDHPEAWGAFVKGTDRAGVARGGKTDARGAMTGPDGSDEGGRRAEPAGEPAIRVLDVKRAGEWYFAVFCHYVDDLGVVPTVGQWRHYLHDRYGQQMPDSDAGVSLLLTEFRQRHLTGAVPGDSGEPSGEGVGEAGPGPAQTPVAASSLGR